VLKLCIQKSSMIQRPLIKLNFSLSKRATRSLLRLGARPLRLDSPQPLSAPVHQPSERVRPLAKHPLRLHSDSLYQHLLLVNPLPIRCLDNSPLRTLQPRPSVQLLDGHPPSGNQLLPNLRSEHLHLGSRHLVSLASVSRLRWPQLRAREGVDSQRSRPSRLPLVNPPLVSPGLVVPLQRQGSVSPDLEARQQVVERGREPQVVVSVPSHHPRLLASHKQLLTHSRQPAPLGRVRALLLSPGATHLQPPLSLPLPTHLDTLSNRRANPLGLILLHSVHRSRSPVL
jgi:hypothetical protein